MRYYIIAGEASGDLHGSNLIKELQHLDTAANIRGWGGDKMKSTGAVLAKHYKDLAFMGFVEIARNLKTILGNLRFCKEDILKYKPDVLVLINYSAFNLRIAKWAKPHGLKVVYYISPQVWAWKENRVKTIKKCVDKMLVVLPFEKAFYKKHGYEVEYVGHPLVKVVDDFRQSMTNNLEAPNPELIALLPGSRKQEILKKLPIMLEVSKHFPEYQFVVAKAPGIEESFYDALFLPYKNVSSIENKTYELLCRTKAALVTSGTATLETALFGVPEVVCYKGNAVSFKIATWLVKIKYICLVNLIMDKEVVKELIQENLTEENITKELNKLLHDTAAQQQLQKDYTALKNLLSQGGNASANAAKIIYDFAINDA